MNISERQRELLERALDDIYDALHDEDPSEAELQRLTKLYCEAAAIVRDRPPGQRKLRSDYGTIRGPRSPAAQGRLVE